MNKPTQALRIIHCQDPKLWYADKVGKTVPLLADEGDMFKSVEPDGYINFVRREDAVIEEVEK